ncbi:MAG TPA: twin transmembrane helix small protein [Geminicoccaceae bacterium]|nr:twin transmembrane helix small protein [Geminicoccaceae bacterium]
MTILIILLLLAMCATLAVLVVGLVGFFLGGEFNAKYGNKLMRARVALQAVAVLLLLIVLISAG